MFVGEIPTGRESPWGDKSHRAIVDQMALLWPSVEASPKIRRILACFLIPF